MARGTGGLIAGRARVSHGGPRIHSPVTIVTKKYLLSPTSGSGPGLGAEAQRCAPPSWLSEGPVSL